MKIEREIIAAARNKRGAQQALVGGDNGLLGGIRGGEFGKRWRRLCIAPWGKRGLAAHLHDAEGFPSSIRLQK